MSNTCAETVAEYFSALRAKDPEGWANTFAPDATSYDPVGTPPMIGHDALRAFLNHIVTSFKDFGLTEDGVYIRGNAAAVKWNGFVVTHAGKRVPFEGIDVIECNDEGKIALVHAYWDPTPVFAALDEKA